MPHGVRRSLRAPWTASHRDCGASRAGTRFASRSIAVSLTYASRGITVRVTADRSESRCGASSASPGNVYAVPQHPGRQEHLSGR
jgi:hypothetical protein